MEDVPLLCREIFCTSSRLPHHQRGQLGGVGCLRFVNGPTGFTDNGATLDFFQSNQLLEDVCARLPFCWGPYSGDFVMDEWIKDGTTSLTDVLFSGYRANGLFPLMG